MINNDLVFNQDEQMLYL